MTAHTSKGYRKQFFCLDEFNMYTYGYSRLRKKDLHLKKAEFNVDSFKLTAEDKQMPLMPPLDHIDEIPFTEAKPIRPNSKEKGQRVDFGITVYPGFGVGYKCFGILRPDKRFKDKRKAPLVFEQKKGISNKEFRKWLRQIHKFQVCYFFIFLYFLLLFCIG
jgi:hypothetical protein